MRVMLTLFHHSLPPWAGEYGGWKVEKTVNYFREFVRYPFLGVKITCQYYSLIFVCSMDSLYAAQACC
jgi:galactolipid galactosyltransferase